MGFRFGRRKGEMGGGWGGQDTYGGLMGFQFFRTDGIGGLGDWGVGGGGGYSFHA